MFILQSLTMFIFKFIHIPLLIYGGIILFNTMKNIYKEVTKKLDFEDELLNLSDQFEGCYESPDEEILSYKTNIERLAAKASKFLVDYEDIIKQELKSDIPSNLKKKIKRNLKNLTNYTNVNYRAYKYRKAIKMYNEVMEIKQFYFTAKNNPQELITSLNLIKATNFSISITIKKKIAEMEERLQEIYDSDFYEDEIRYEIELENTENIIIGYIDFFENQLSKYKGTPLPINDEDIKFIKQNYL